MLSSCFIRNESHAFLSILLTITTAAQNQVELSYHKVRRLHFLAVIFAVTTVVGREISRMI